MNEHCSYVGKISNCRGVGAKAEHGGRDISNESDPGGGSDYRYRQKMLISG